MVSPKAKALVHAGRIWVCADFALVDICRRLPSRIYDPVTRRWHVPLTSAHALAVVDAFGDRLVESDAVVELADRARPLKGAEPDPVVPSDSLNYEHRTPPWTHQRYAYWFTRQLWARNRPGVLLAMEMGTGKTKVAVDLICSLKLDPVLILCPKPVVSVWPRQFEIHGWGASLCPALKGSIKARTEQTRLFLSTNVGRGPRVVIANYEIIDRNSSLFAELAMSTHWSLVVCDEVHRIKAPGGLRSRYLSRLGDRVPKRLGLTGTPLPHSPLDAYAEYRFLDKTVFGTSFLNFKSRYAVMGGFNNLQVVGWKNRDEFTKLMGGVMFQAKADEVLDLPEAIHNVVPVELEKHSRIHYDALEDDFVTWVREDQAVTASNALVRLLRLQQISAGFLPLEDGRAEKVGDEKTRALKEILEEVNETEPVVVFARFHHDLDAIAEASLDLGRVTLELSGRRNELAEWQAGRAPVLAAQIQAGKEGVDLSRARYCVYYDQTFSLGDYEQSLARIRRPGQQAKTVFYYHLVATRTVDERIRQALEQKRDVVDHVLAEARRQT